MIDFLHPPLFPFPLEGEAISMKKPARRGQVQGLLAISLRTQKGRQVWGVLRDSKRGVLGGTYDYAYFHDFAFAALVFTNT